MCDGVIDGDVKFDMPEGTISRHLGHHAGENCFLPLKYRTELTKLYNGLRLFVARGLLDETHKKHLMYGVKYDCGLEEVAGKIIHGEDFADHYGVIRFSNENLGNLYGSIIDSFNELLDDKEQMKQAVYPPPTRFGCYSEIESGKKLVNAVCVYDSKLARFCAA
ncbi:unnamed protein product [Cylicocyclus nassatus]|uniref:Uncharacterized protein n=1 Tax=Cylicocyclus nassatus TaxID=53992 RepID=A0AA36GP57_CYLNA|nr:unnamed protein product [Cylicocyclus nassatus]